MDRLEPVLKQKFWILLAIGISMTVAGWWMATSGIAKDITDRTSSVDASFKSIPTGDIPNESWAKRLGAINTDQANAIESTKLSMWKRQRDRMNWPDGITDPGYMGKFTNSQRELFRDSYEDEVRRVWKVVNPLNSNDGTGIVEYPLKKVYEILRHRSWDMAPPDSEVMWTVREDMWLLESLFQTITSMNGGFDVSRADACIHQIDKLQLRGGGEKLRDSVGGGGGGGGVDMSAFGGMAGGRGPGGPGGITDGLKMVSAEFDAAEEFGDDGSSTAATRGGMGAFGGMSSSFVPDGSAPSIPAAAAPAADIKRYLLIDANLPFKKRGFYLSVKMDHTKIPLLIAELTANEKSVWPIEIYRVQMSRLNEDDSTGPKPIRGAPMSGSQSSSVGFSSSPSSEADNFNSSNPFGVSNSFSEFPTNPKPGSGLEASNTLLGQQMRVALENTLKDPVMAQVTICGAITIFKEVKEPEVKKPAPAVPATTAPATEDSETMSPTVEETAEKTETLTPEPMMDAAAEAKEPAETAAEMNATNEPNEKPEAMEKPEPKEPKPETSEK